ncbi:lysylphosphatidylglycerol synthase domain-containing protein [Mesorhizobium sp. LHD-90]|uniref:lysylphosphatidylglycerol synthase domain-containing protein n=1 Tax=Mesorhizobium sp. LHD-90 TaxID=3071414 RepID=UPI0027DF6565|nr:lysylphosphatidylglycerol synthase domain-containing protein [Mesorhizobium sp. LHD-90]MDQ6435670.1 lysylphosphatidylglycerol synthase domain-containing protein [Mesorhizobium sp. LHD-90]
MADTAAKRGWLARNRTVLLTVGVILLYAGFVQWAWGWPSILAAWQEVGIGTILLALILLVATYFVRAHRIHDYFPRETAGRFLWLFRVTQVHNILNIMLPLRTGETSFPLLMRSEFGVPLAHGTSALLVLRLLDLHALLAAAGVGLVAATGYRLWAWALWLVFLALPLVVFPVRDPAIALARKRLPQKFARLVDQIEDGIPRGLGRFARAWALTVLNWGVKVLVLAWVLALMGVEPLAACFGGALGGELSSVLPVHAPGGVGTYPAGIAAGAAVFGAGKDAATLAALAKAGINTHLLVIVSALAGAAISLVLPHLSGRAHGAK